jgi:hypothetical protein
VRVANVAVVSALLAAACSGGSRAKGPPPVDDLRRDAAAEESVLPPPPPRAAPKSVTAEKCRGGGNIDQEHLKTCVEACESGDMPSCGLAAAFLDSGGLGIQRDPAAAARLYQRACDKGGAIGACSLLGQMLIEGRPGIRADAARGRALVEKGCKGGDEMACEYLEGVRYTVKKVYQWSADGGEKHH